MTDQSDCDHVWVGATDPAYAYCPKCETYRLRFRQGSNYYSLSGTKPCTPIEKGEKED